MPDEQKEVEEARQQGREARSGWNNGHASPKIHELSRKLGAFKKVKDLIRSK